ncbi:MAG TPA: FkbM family methyltransferase [Roseiarcus sp.]|jgi:FkbM family methyltransferase|nr:FkbM family methyltransferase [Roseiarcus sp.]
MVDNSLIFDVGCHIGQDSAFYLKKGFKVVAVEANPALCMSLRQRFGDQIAEGRFILIEKAIAEKAGEVEFYLNEHESVRSTISIRNAEIATALGKPPIKTVVPSTTFSTLIEEFGVPHYMKVDIEGVDILCLEGLVPFAERPNFISTEYPLSLAEQISELLLFRKLGYVSFQLVDQKSVPSQVPPWPPREGQYVDDNFEIMCSGLFGAELPGAWLTFGGAISWYLMLFARNKRMGLLRRVPGLSHFAGHGSWYDIHAALPTAALSASTELESAA